MTPDKSGPTNVVVVDGSNIATEGRSMPSLSQLNDAVMAFTEEFPDAIVTVVVDATFGHRIEKNELAEFDAAVAHNEVVAPPAGAIGRGDAFVLSIANKVGARILSNDSFQEFHGDYPWLFDEGRLIGGKPVPFVGWVFVERLPVKGPISRKATRATRSGGGEGRGRDRDRDREPRQSRRTASRAASLPMPVPTAPPPGPRRSDGGPADEPDVVVETVGETSPARAAAPAGGPVNDLLPFLDFVEHHPVGSSVNGVVESYSSHGAYVTIGDLRGYIPLRLMGDPPPRSAREIMKLGDAVTLVVTSFAPGRRSVDLSIPTVAPEVDLEATPVLDDLVEAAGAAPAKPSRRRGAKKAAPEPTVAVEAPTPEPVKQAPAKRAAAKRAAKKAAPQADAPAAPVTPEAPPAAVAPVKARTRRSAAKAAAPVGPETPPVATVPAPKPVRPRKATAKKAPAPAPAPSPVTPPAKKAAAKKAAAAKAPATKAAAAPAAKKAAAAPAATAVVAKKAPAKRATKKVAAPRGGGAA
jgi:hypothetical protein